MCDTIVSIDIEAGVKFAEIRGYKPIDDSRENVHYSMLRAVHDTACFSELAELRENLIDVLKDRLQKDCPHDIGTNGLLFSHEKEEEVIEQYLSMEITMEDGSHR